MRILVVSNLYPPNHKSGYELGCQDLVRSLKIRQHHVKVLTSTYGTKRIQVDNDIHRVLAMNSEDSPDWKDVFLKEFTNQTIFKKICQDFKPEISFFFDLSHVSLSLYSLAQKMGIPACSYYANNWFITRELDQWHQLWPDEERGFRILRYLTNRFHLLPPQQLHPTSNSIFANRYLKNLAIQLKKTTPDASVIPLGIDTGCFPFKETTSPKPGRMLYAGQIHPDKGIEDVIEALQLLCRNDGHGTFSLAIAGDEKSSPDYVKYLWSLAEKLGILKNLTFIGSIPPDKMPKLYHAYDILVSPSHIEDSSNRTLMEAMSSGIPVVGVLTNSNSEFLEDEVNALIFPKDDPDSCAEKIRRLSEDRKFMESLRMNARSTIERKFQLERSIDSLERILRKSAEKALPNGQLTPHIYNSLPGNNQSDVSLDILVKKAKRWLMLGKIVVFVRIWARPKFLMHIPINIYKKTIAFTPHRFNAIIFNTYYFLNGHRRKKSKSDLRSIQKILVVQLADIGDVILTSPFLRELRRLYPKAWIALTVQPRMFNLIEKCPYVDHVIPFDWGASKNWDTYLRGAPYWWRQSCRLAKKDLWNRHLDLAVSTRWNEDPCQAASLILMHSSGAALRIAYKATPADRMRYGWKDLNRLITRGPVRSFPKHEVEHHMDILRFIGGNPHDTHLEVWTTPEDELYAQSVLDKNDITHADVLIAFAPGAAWPFRRWPSERFIELGNWLQKIYDANILILAAKNEQELALRIEKGLQPEKTINLAGKTSLREMASILKHCNLFIGNDSGPLHVATAAGTPVVGFYGPGEYQRFKPWGRNHDTLRLGLSCSPCSQNCKFREPRCIEGITVSQAKKLLTRKLGSILDLP